jgi:AbrB family looped-hinge helix DNA binding protein
MGVSIAYSSYDGVIDMAQTVAAPKRSRPRSRPKPVAPRDSRLTDPRTHQTTVSSKYQVVIPKRVREAAGIKPGQTLDVQVHDGVVMLVPIPPIEELRGRFRGINLEDIREEVDRY